MGSEVLRNLPESPQLVACGHEGLCSSLIRITQCSGFRPAVLSSTQLPCFHWLFFPSGFPLSCFSFSCFLSFYLTPLTISPFSLFLLGGWIFSSCATQNEMATPTNSFNGPSREKLWLWKVLDDMEKAGS